MIWFVLQTDLHLQRESNENKMKSVVCSLLISMISLSVASQINEVSGFVTDEKKAPMSFVNVFIEGSMDGASTDDKGFFSFKTEQQGEVVLMASYLGYQPWKLKGDIQSFTDVKIQLSPSEQAIKEVVVVAGNYMLKSASTLQSQNAVNLVSTAGSEGDLYRAIATLPGTQASGIDGRLLVRGGDSRESQTYIDDMHVLSPYTAVTQTTGSRGRFSPFLFEGINFSTGGYSPEFSQSLSSILPLSTKNESPVSKFGASLMNVSAGTGGTKAWEKGSVSFNFDYTDINWDNTLFRPDQKKYWEKPYKDYSGQSQLRFRLGRNSFLKTYFAYSKTLFVHNEETSFSNMLRKLDYNEDNLYLNSTFKTHLSNGVGLFAGAAYSWNKKGMESARVFADRLKLDEKELHLKAKGSKRFSNRYKLEFGMESFIREYDISYRDTFLFEGDLKHHISGFYLSNDFSLTDRLFVNLSSRLEYTSLDKGKAFLPRLALNYEWKGITMSGVVGKYQQIMDNDQLLYNKKLPAEENIQYMLGFYFRDKSRIYRVELYHKEYDNLPVTAGGRYTSDGYGYSRGVDVFLNDRQFMKHWEYMVAYSYNDSKRKYLNYPEKASPTFTSKHNVSATLKYSNWKIKSIIGLTNRFASGRPYHDPNRDGFMNAHAPVYNTLDFSWTWLAHKRLIVYASFSNLLNRENVYGYTYASSPDSKGRYDRLPVKADQNQAFYIGLFLTLGKNVAYDASNF